MNIADATESIFSLSVNQANKSAIAARLTGRSQEVKVLPEKGICILKHTNVELLHNLYTPNICMNWLRPHSQIRFDQKEKTEKIFAT